MGERRRVLGSAAAIGVGGNALLRWSRAWAQEQPFKPEAGAQLRFLRWSRFLDAEDKATTENIQAFTEATGVPVRVDNVWQDDLQPQLSVAANVGSGPDLAWMLHTTPHLFADKLLDLSDMAGGTETGFAAAEPMLAALGTTVLHVGPPGAGQTVKACNQLVCTMNLQAICEALALGRAAGLDLELLREVLLGGAAASWMLENLGPKMIAKDASADFRIDLKLKDLRLAGELAFGHGLPLPGLALATSLYLEARARAHGEGSNGNQALFLVYDRLTNQEGRI